MELPRAILVDGLTQSAKTWKVFEMIAQNIQKDSHTCVLFIAQANSTTAANQICCRAKNDIELQQKIPYIYRISDILQKEKKEKQEKQENKENRMIVEFWNARNTKKIIDDVKTEKPRNILIIMDEADQGFMTGLRSRLDFIQNIEKEKISLAKISVIFITATVPNLSKTIYYIAKKYSAKFQHGIVRDILQEKCISHHFVLPKDEYIGPSWFIMQNSHLWKQLILREKNPKEEKDHYIAYKNNYLYEQLEKLSQKYKELCLIVPSTQKDDHHFLSQKLFQIGFNVIVELNSENLKNYNVYYRSITDHKIKIWNIPYTELEFLAEKKKLSFYRYHRNFVKTNIESKFDLSLAHVLQSALFMGTETENRIQENIKQDEFIKLLSINNAICCSVSKMRPEDFPVNPYVALIAGHIAGRGITLQNAFIDFVCTSFCFVGKKDRQQRGAQNAQTFGRACGMLSNIFVEKKREPILLASPNIVFDAYINELCLREKANDIKDGEMIYLKDMVPEKEWKKINKSHKHILHPKTNDKHVTQNINPMHMMDIYTRILDILDKHPEGVYIRDIKNIDENVFHMINKTHNNQIHILYHKFKFIEKKNNKWILTALGKTQLYTK